MNCPVCGTSAHPNDRACRVCAFDFAQAVSGGPKCGRCGSEIPAGSGFCQVCGLQLSSRRGRPGTGRLNIRTLVRPAPAGAGAASPRASAPDYPGAAGRLPGGAVGSNDPTPLPQMIQGQPGGAPSPGGFVANPLPSQVGTSPEFDHPARAMAPHAAPAPPSPAQALDLAVPNAPTMFSMSPDAAAKAKAGAHPAPAPAPKPAPAAQPGPARFPDATPVPRQVQAAVSPLPGVGSSPAAGPELVIVRRDGSEGDRFSLAPGQLSVGRTQGDIRFPTDSFISNPHARITRRNDGVELVDLGSRNGVYVRILSPQPVYPGDHFLLGHQLMRLDNLGPEDREQPADHDGVRMFGTPVDPAWGKLSCIGVGGQPSDVHYLRGGQTTFGRENGDVLFPNDNFLSRRHARLRMEMRQGAMSVVLEDMASANGTYLRLRGNAVLGENDMFRVGDQLFRVRGIG